MPEADRRQLGATSCLPSTVQQAGGVILDTILQISNFPTAASSPHLDPQRRRVEVVNVVDWEASFVG